MRLIGMAVLATLFATWTTADAQCPPQAAGVNVRVSWGSAPAAQLVRAPLTAQAPVYYAAPAWPAQAPVYYTVPAAPVFYAAPAPQRFEYRYGPFGGLRRVRVSGW